MVTFIFTCKPLGHKEVEDLVKYDPGEEEREAKGGAIEMVRCGKICM